MSATDRLRTDIGDGSFGTVIIGGGPAGTGPLFAALKAGTFDDLLRSGLAIIERSSHLVRGSLSRYNVNSDTLAGVFLECLDGRAGDPLDTRTLLPWTGPIARHAGRSIPLNELDGFLKELGRRLENLVRRTPGCSVSLRSSARRIERRGTDAWAVLVEGPSAPILTRNVLIATGGLHARTLRSAAGGSKVLIGDSDDLLSGGMDDRLSKCLHPGSRIVIVGGGHSGFSAAWYLLQRFGQVLSGPASIRIMGAARPKVYFQTAEEALRNDYGDHTPDDVCPLTGRLFRLAGLRMDGRELYLRMIGLNEPREERVEFVQDDRRSWDDIVHDHPAEVIIDATGYRHNAIDIRDENGERIAMQGEMTGHWVDQRCRLVDREGAPIEGLYATGLATGFVPSRALGGEPSFHGQTNGLWYYQNLVGGLIAEELLNAHSVPVS